MPLGVPCLAEGAEGRLLEPALPDPATCPGPLSLTAL